MLLEIETFPRVFSTIYSVDRLMFSRSTFCQHNGNKWRLYLPWNGSGAFLMSVETQWNHMFWRVSGQTTLKDGEVASDDRVDAKQCLEPWRWLRQKHISERSNSVITRLLLRRSHVSREHKGEPFGFSRTGSTCCAVGIHERTLSAKSGPCF